MFKSILIYSILALFAFTQTAGKIGLYNKAYKTIFSMSSDASESEKLEQDDASEDADFDALPQFLNGKIKLRSVSILLNLHQDFISNHYSIPDSPPPDFI